MHERGQPLAEQQLLFLFVAAGTAALYRAAAVPRRARDPASRSTAPRGGSASRCARRRAPPASSRRSRSSRSRRRRRRTTSSRRRSRRWPRRCCSASTRLELGCGGAAAAFGLGTKLTTGLVLPILVVLALARGRRVFAEPPPRAASPASSRSACGATSSTTTTAGHVLGAGTRTSRTGPRPSYPGSVANAFYLMYGMMDASVLSSRLIRLLAVDRLVLAARASRAWCAAPRPGVRQALGDAAGVALPFLAPLLVIGGAGVVACVAGALGLPDPRRPAGRSAARAEPEQGVHADRRTRTTRRTGRSGSSGSLAAARWRSGPGCGGARTRGTRARDGAAALPRADLALVDLGAVPDPLLPAAGRARGAAPRALFRSRVAIAAYLGGRRASRSC